MAWHCAWLSGWQRVRRAHQPLQDLVHGARRMGRQGAGTAHAPALSPRIRHRGCQWGASARGRPLGRPLGPLGRGRAVAGRVRARGRRAVAEPRGCPRSPTASPRASGRRRVPFSPRGRLGCGFTGPQRDAQVKGGVSRLSSVLLVLLPLLRI
uniref:Uncharacterized protein n=1 Tax=Nothoprocta perdicaria TaxID=30464 RepID=A0A8C6Z851_NOTPE